MTSSSSTSSASSGAAERMTEALLQRASVEVAFHNIITAATRDIDLVFGSSEPQHQSCIDFLEYIIKNLFRQSSDHEETNVVKALRQEMEKLKIVSLPKVRAVSFMDNPDKAVKIPPKKNIQLLLSQLGELAFDAEGEFAKFNYNLQKHEMLIRVNQEKDEVGAGISTSEIFLKEFRGEMLPQVKVLLSMLENINEKVAEAGFPDHEEFNSSSLILNEQDEIFVPDLEFNSRANLSPRDFWSTIKHKANLVGEADSTEFEEIGMQIAEKCQGLPLAANLLGGLLRGKEAHFWTSILESRVLLDAENVVSQILRLVFESLPSPFIQKCFAFAAMLPRDSVIERLQLIQLWMAEGFLDPEIMGYDTPEEVGDQYFDILLRFSLFQPVTMDKYSNKITHCKMHGLVHDFASSISRFESMNGFSSVKPTGDTSLIRHIAFDSFDQENFKIACWKNGNHLKTLFLRSDVMHWYDYSRLQVLNLSGTHMANFLIFPIPMILLEYLDLSSTPIISLSNSFCEFHKLHTLRISECNSFQEFPQDFKNLLNLRHLHNYVRNDFDMPREIGRMTNLQTLSVFNVGKATGFRIGELNSLKNLRKRLEIWNLDYVSDKKEAQQADLFGKPHLQELLLHWPKPELRSEEDMGALPDEDVLDGLQPHPNLKCLVIENFLGDRFPAWVMNMSVSAGGSLSRLNNLVEVKLTKCYSLRELPTLGLLPLLRYLELAVLDEVTLIGPSFYDEKGSRESEIASQIPMVYFPALKSLTLDTLKGLQGWMGLEETSASEAVAVFPELESLSISRCSRLESAPSDHFLSLKEFIANDVASSSLLVNICNKATSLTNLQIQQGVGFVCLPDGLLQNKPNLARLHIEDCQSLTSLVSSDMSSCFNLGSVRELVIRNCGNLEELPADLFESLQSLENLEISKCPKLKSIPTSFGQDGLTSLSSLLLCDCPTSGLEKFTSLRSLDIDGNHEQDSLPQEIQHLSALEHLTLRCFCIESLPDWMEKLSSLQELHLISCESLQSFPPSDNMRRLEKLRKLITKECPLLFQRWTDQSNPDCEWSKVSGISTIFADEREVSDPCFWKNYFGTSSVEKKKKAKKKTGKKSNKIKSKPQSHIKHSTRI